MFVTFEGIEGSGKTTQIRRTADYLREKGKTVLTTREPGGTDIGKRLRAILLDPENTDLDHRAELLLYMADRAQHIATVVQPALADGKIVLCDRYVDATWAYQGYARGIDLALLKDLHRLVLEDFMPEMTILLDLPPEAGLLRAWREINAGIREESETRFEEETLVFHRKVRDGYLALAKGDPDRIRVIDGGRDEESVQNDLRALFEGLRK